MKNNNGISLIKLILVVLLLIIIASVCFIILKDNTNYSVNSKELSKESQNGGETIEESGNSANSFWLEENCNNLGSQLENCEINLLNTKVALPTSLNEFKTLYDENLNECYYYNLDNEKVSFKSLEELMNSTNSMIGKAFINVYRDDTNLQFIVSNLNDKRIDTTIKEGIDNNWWSFEFVQEDTELEEILDIDNKEKIDGSYNSKVLFENIVAKFGGPKYLYKQKELTVTDDYELMFYNLCYEYGDYILCIGASEMYEGDNYSCQLTDITYYSKPIFEEEIKSNEYLVLLHEEN